MLGASRLIYWRLPRFKALYLQWCLLLILLRLGLVVSNKDCRERNRRNRPRLPRLLNITSKAWCLKCTNLIYYMFYDTHCTMSSCLWWYSYCNCSASSTLVTDVICIASRSNSAAFLWQITASSKRLHKIWLSAFLSFWCAWKIHITVRLLASREGTQHHTPKYVLIWFLYYAVESTYINSLPYSKTYPF